MTGCTTPLKLDFYRKRSLSVEFSDLDLSSDARILLARQAEERLQICLGLSECIQEWRDPDKITHSWHQLVSQLKELKLGMSAGRLSCRTFVANQFRLLLAQAAYLLMLTLRRAATGTRLATAQVERLRSALIKGAPRVRVSARRVLVELAAFCPFAQEICSIAQRLCEPFALQLG